MNWLVAAICAVFVGIGRRFPQIIELLGIRGEIQIENRPAILRPDRRSQSSLGDMELAVLAAIEIHQPQFAIATAVQQSGAAGRGIGSEIGSGDSTTV